MCELRVYLCEKGMAESYNFTFSKQKRSHFLQALEEMIQSIKRSI